MLTRKTFTTKDSNGCEFNVEATYYGKEYNFQAGKYEKKVEYRAMGLQSNSLAEIKKLVSSK